MGSPDMSMVFTVVEIEVRCMYHYRPILGSLNVPYFKCFY